MFSGYGDPNKNTGPVDIYTFDLATKSLTDEVTFFSESLEQFQIINGVLYTPAIDPTGSGDIYARREVNGSWYADTPFSAIHVFDVETLTGSDIYLAGSTGKNAAVWRSGDDGQTWQNVLKVAPLQGYSRFYMTPAVNGMLYAQAVDSQGGAHPSSWTSTDGVNWQSGGPTLLLPGNWGYDPKQAFGGVVYRSGPSYVLGGLYFFDGSQVRKLIPEIRNALGLRRSPGGMGGHAVASDGSLYVVSWRREVFRTANLITWERLGKVKGGNATGTAIAVANRTVYVGLSNSKIYSVTLP